MSYQNRVVVLAITIFSSFYLTIFPTALQAQGLGNSPYSSLGMGEFYGDGFSDNVGMAQSGVSTSAGFQINNLNPALWVRNKFTTLDFGLVGQYKNIDRGRQNQRNAGGNLAYVTLAFPVSTRWVIGASLKPYSFVDYTNTATRIVPGTAIPAQYFVSGKGGVNKASITNAFQIGKYVSVGLESSYFFGNIRRASEVSLPISADGSDYLVTLNNRTTYSDIAFRAGTAVRIPIKKANKLNLNLGGVYSFGTQLNSTQTTTFELSQGSYNVIAPDTLDNNVSGATTIPEQYQVGASLEWPLKLVLSADYSRQSWSGYRSFINTNEGLRDVNRFHLGAELLPRFTSLKYFDLVRYRVGVSHGNTPFAINGNVVNDTYVSLGLTLPMGRFYQNFLSVALIAGQRGNTNAGLIRERYGRVVLGITLLEKWFIKQKLD